MKRFITLMVAVLASAVTCVALAAMYPNDRPLPLGTVYLEGIVPPGSEHALVDEHVTFTVSCPDVRDDARGILGITRPEGSARGVVMLFSGGLGTGWWAGENQLVADFFRRLGDAGLTIVMVRWIDSWMVSAPGESVGAARLACRVASVVDWVHANLYDRAPRVTKEPGSPGRPSLCGFCISGFSGGSSQVLYALAYYGLDRILDGVVPTGALPHAGQYISCQRFPGTFGYENWYTTLHIQILDASYGFGLPVPPFGNPNTSPPFGSGPCATNDSLFIPRWIADSIDTGGNDYFHPTTAIQFIWGEQDNAPSGAPGVANAPWVAYAYRYLARLLCEGSPYVTTQLVPNTPHAVQSTAEGLATIAHALLGPRPKHGPETDGRRPREDCVPNVPR